MPHILNRKQAFSDALEIAFPNNGSFIHHKKYIEIGIQRMKTLVLCSKYVAY
jgi:hypothetical protein